MNCYEFDNQYRKNNPWLIGIDEVGRGPLAGPVVCAAVCLDPQNKIKGLNDSKKIPPRKRENLLQEITQKALKIGIGMAFPEEIDKINIYQATIMAMKRAIRVLGFSSGIVLIDGLRFDYPNFKTIKIIKGDTKSASIMAASIIAKVIRDRLMVYYDQKYPGYGFARHKGYATLFHKKAIQTYGFCEIHRKSFEPIKSMVEKTLF